LARRVQDKPNRKAQLDELEEAIEHLKVAYDRYFYGVDKIPPIRNHEAVERLVRELLRRPVSSTQLRFRFNTLRARLNTYGQYWNRILRQIEAGTYKRVLAESERREFLGRQRRRAERAEGDAAEAEDAAPAAGGRARVPSRPPDLPSGMDAKEARELFKSFVQAKRAAGEKTEGITYGALVRKLANEVPKLEAKHGGKVRFEVATEGGRVRLRARRNS